MNSQTKEQIKGCNKKINDLIHHGMYRICGEDEWICSACENKLTKEQVEKGTQKDFERMFRNAKQPLTKILHPYNNQKQEKDCGMNSFIKVYIEFKDKCVKQEIMEINEIIKLFEVWTRTCS